MVEILKARGVSSDTRFGVLSTPPSERRGNPHRVADDWPTGHEMKGVIEELFAAKGMQGDVKLGDAKRVRHPREFRVSWADGRVWRLRLDQGFGFVETVGSVPHSFGGSPRAQGLALASVAFEVQAKNPGYLYVYPVE